MKGKTFVWFLFCLFCFSVIGQDQPAVVLVSKKGSVYLWNVGTGRWEDVPGGARLSAGSYLRTGKDAEAIIAFGRKAVVTLSSDTLVQIKNFSFQKESLKKLQIEAKKGRLWSVVEKLPVEGKLEIETPNALAGVRGTVFLVGYNPEEESSKIAVISGEVSVSSKLVEGYVVLKENMCTVVVANKPPVPPQVLEEKERQEWERWKERIPFSQIGIVGGIAEINALQSQEAARLVREMGMAKKGSEKVKKDFENIESAILLYYVDTRTVPRRLKDLMENPGVTGWKGPYLGAGTNFMDPYGHPYQYKILKTPKGKEYLELSTFGLAGAGGETWGEEKKFIYVDQLEEKWKEKLDGATRK